MTTNTTRKANFVIIDDSELDCFIAEKMVKHAGISGEVKSFMQAGEALEYLRQLEVNDDTPDTIILLDILMPVMSGIDFVEEFEKLPANIQDKCLIAAFTSSMNKKDVGRMKSFKSVKFIFDKPLSPEVLMPLLDGKELLP